MLTLRQDLTGEKCHCPRGLVLSYSHPVGMHIRMCLFKDVEDNRGFVVPCCLLKAAEYLV